MIVGTQLLGGNTFVAAGKKTVFLATLGAWCFGFFAHFCSFQQLATMSYSSLIGLALKLGRLDERHMRIEDEYRRLRRKNA
jgi:hypothetical protein